MQLINIRQSGLGYFRALVMVVTVLCGASSSALAKAYTFVTILDSIPGTGGVGYHLNNGNQVVGASGVGAALWDGGAPSQLGTFGGAAWGINDSGVVVGTAPLTPTSTVHAFTWSGGVLTDLGSPGLPSEARRVNSAGQVVGGRVLVERGLLQATVWNGTAATLLNTPVGFSSMGYDINESGVAVGTIYTVSGADDRATVWDASGGHELTTLGGSRSTAIGINDVGNVVGYSNLPGDLTNGFRATFWDGASVVNLGSLGGWSYAYDISNRGQIIGAVSDRFDGAHAAMWLNSASPPIDLNDFLHYTVKQAGWSLQDARGVNEAGSISGTAFNRFTREQAAYLLYVSSVPESSTTMLMVTGLCFLAYREKRRRMCAQPKMG